MSLPHTYGEAASRHRSARYPDRGKPLNHNTRVMCHPQGTDPPAYSVKLHDTNIVTFYANGHIHINHEGWTTPTTRERINEALRPPWDPGVQWNDVYPYVGGRCKSGWTDQVGRGGQLSHRESYFYVRAANGSYVIPHYGITLNLDKRVIDPEQYETHEHWLDMEAQEDRVRRAQRKAEQTEEEIDRFLRSSYPCVFTPYKLPLACVFPRTSPAFVPSLVLVDKRSRSKLKEEVLLRASQVGNRIDLVETTVLRDAVRYVQT